MVGADLAARLAADLVGPGAAVSPEGSGWDHVAWRVVGADGRPWIVRWRIEGDRDELATEVRREVAVMQTARRALGDLVGDAVVLDEAIGCLAHPRLPGTPLHDLLAAGRVPPDGVDRLAREIGSIIATIGRLSPPPEVAVDDGLRAWFDGLAPFVDAIGHLLSVPERAAVERFVRSGPPGDPPASDLRFAHNDLGAEHVLVDPAGLAITGIIDWSDGARADQAAELGRLLRDLGAEHLAAVLDGAQVTARQRAGMSARAWSYARCLVLEDLAYAVARRPGLVAFERAALASLFAGV